MAEEKVLNNPAVESSEAVYDDAAEQAKYQQRRKEQMEADFAKLLGKPFAGFLLFNQYYF